MTISHNGSSRKKFGENFINEATRSDPQWKILFIIVEIKDWESIKYLKRYWYSLRRDLSTKPTGCILYEGKLFIPSQLRRSVLNSIHKNHPGQTAMMHTANIIWFPRNHREIVTLPQGYAPCKKVSEKLKSFICKNTTAQ